MDDGLKETVSYLVYESSQTRLDRIIHRLIVALIVSVGLLFASNLIWMYMWSQYDFISDEVTVSNTDGITTFVGNDNGGVVRNGNGD